MTAKSNHKIRKFLYWIALAGLILGLCFGTGGSPAARAQAGWTDTPTNSTGQGSPTLVEKVLEPPAGQKLLDSLTTRPSLSADGLTLSNAVPPLIILADPNPAMHGIKVPLEPELRKALANPAAASASFSFTFLAAGASDPWGQVCSTFPDNARTAFSAAAAIWTSTIQSSVPIKIEACWASLSSSNILGYSGGSTLLRDFSGAPQANTWYETSLANALHGSDLGAASFDDYITYNTNFSWYFGTDSNPPAGQYDLVSVAAHEIAHGLNFSGSAQYSSGTGQFGYSGYPVIFDKFMEDSGGTKLTSYTNPSSALGSLLTSGSVWFDGSNADSANSGSRVRMYAPGTWSDGSSYSHLDYTTFAGTVNSMMVYAIADGSANHNPGPVTLGMLKDMGWVLAGGSPTPTNTPTQTRTSTKTSTPSNTPTFTRTSTRTYTLTSTPTKTSTPSNTSTFTRTPTRTNTPTFTRTPTKTSTPTLTPTKSATAHVRDDYDGDGKTDPAEFYASTGAVWWLKSSTGLWDGMWLGSDTFQYVGASDFDGDGKTDPAKFYPGTGTVWWVKSSTGTLGGQWLGPDLFTYITGSDFDGDGKADPAKFYPATGTVWWVKSSTGTLDGQWLGADSFQYVSGSDFDGDGKTDPAKFYPSTGTVWWVKSTTHTMAGMYLGSDTFDYVAASDFDGDGKTDPAKYYPGTNTVWWVRSIDGALDGAWMGSGTFTYVAGCDFNGDGRTDPAKFDASTHTLSWLNTATSAWTDVDMGTGTYTLANGQ